VFVAEEVLAKHDENYMPPEVAEALKKSGKWKDGKMSEMEHPENIPVGEGKSYSGSATPATPSAGEYK